MTMPGDLVHRITTLLAIGTSGDGVNTQTLAATFTMSLRDEQMQDLDGGVANRDVILPVPTRDTPGLFYLFFNRGATNTLVIKDVAATVVTLAIGESAIVGWNGANWKLVSHSSTSAGIIAAANTWALLQTYTTGLRIVDSGVIGWGTGGGDLLFTADGTDVVVTGTGVLNMVDSLAFAWGTGKDITQTFTTPNLVFAAAVADTGAIHYGVDGAGIDVIFFGDTAGSKITWDQTADSLLITDSTPFSWGDGGDVLMQFDGTNLKIHPAVDDTGAVAFGADDLGMDVIFYGATASANITWNQSDDSLILSGVAKIKTQIIAAATGTAIPVTNSGSFPITQNGAETNTLADPTFIGQWLNIFVDTDTSGARVITAASRINQAAETIITLTEVGDFIKLEAITIAGALKWQVVSNDGAVLS